MTSLFSSRAVPCTQKNIYARALPVTKAWWMCVGWANSSKIRFFSQCPLHGCCAGSAAWSGWVWSKWECCPAALLVLVCMEWEGSAHHTGSFHALVSTEWRFKPKLRAEQQSLGLVGNLRARWCWIRLRGWRLKVMDSPCPPCATWHSQSPKSPKDI